MTGSIDGKPFSTSGDIAVSPRDWSGLGYVDGETFEVLPDGAPDDLPQVVSAAHHLGKTNFDATFTRNAGRVVATGPNAGLEYFAGLPLRLTARVTVNTLQFKPGSYFWKLQSPNRTNFGGLYWCGRSDVAGLEKYVRLHEGTSRTDKQASHIRTYTAELLAQQKAMENHIGVPLNADAILERAGDAAARVSRKLTDTTENPMNALRCTLNFDPTRFR